MASPRPSPPSHLHPHPKQIPRVTRRVLGSSNPSSSLQASNRNASNGGRLSPSASEVSLTATSEISRGSALVCPICSEEMVTLLQLNRHLDDTHAEVESLEKDDITTWFRKRMLKAKAFQPVAVLNQKLKGLDVFEANDLPGDPQQGYQQPHQQQQQQRDADFHVTRAHWQKSYGDDFCLDPTCQRPLGVVNGCVNCRKCGKLFCEEHTMYQIRLSRSAQHEPVRGYWSRVCETCYKSREGYNDHHGVVRDHTEMFRNARKRTVERSCLEVSRLEKRLTKLTQLLINPPPATITANGDKASVIRGLTKPLINQRRALEQSVVAWEDDAAVAACPYCLQTFSRFTLPKHHCRLCGKIVCGDHRTFCSKEITLDVAPSTAEKPLSTPDGPVLHVRMCTPCATTLFSKRDFAASLSTTPSYVRPYTTLVSFQNGIKEQLPRFQRLVDSLQRRPGDRVAVVEAVRMKKRVVETLGKVDALAKQIAGQPAAQGSAEERLRKSIALATANWGRDVGLRVKSAAMMLDRVVDSTRPSAAAEIAQRTGRAPPNMAKPLPTPNHTPAPARTVEEGENDEDNQRRDVVVVLEEQKFLVLAMMEEAKKRRRFDEVEALSRSLDEIEDEIGKLGGGVLGV